MKLFGLSKIESSVLISQPLLEKSRNQDVFEHKNAVYIFSHKIQSNRVGVAVAFQSVAEFLVVDRLCNGVGFRDFTGKFELVGDRNHIIQFWGETFSPPPNKITWMSRTNLEVSKILEVQV